MSKEREAFEEYEIAKKPNANPRLIFQRFESEDLGEDEQSYAGRYYRSDMQEKWELWQAAKAQAVPEGFVLVPKEPTEEMIKAGQEQQCDPFLDTDGIYKAMIEAQQPSSTPDCPDEP